MSLAVPAPERPRGGPKGDGSSPGGPTGGRERHGKRRTRPPVGGRVARDGRGEATLIGEGEAGGAARSGEISLPREVEEVLGRFRTCEFSTMARSGTPIAWPVAALWRPKEGRFVLTTSVGLAQKALNVRREPKVSLLFSDPTASGLGDAPAVLVQGDADAPDEVRTSAEGFEDYWEKLFERQPSGGMYGANALARYLFDWYYMRIYLFVRPRRFLWWPRGDFGRPPKRLEVARSAG